MAAYVKSVVLIALISLSVVAAIGPYGGFGGNYGGFGGSPYGYGGYGSGYGGSPYGGGYGGSPYGYGGASPYGGYGSGYGSGYGVGYGLGYGYPSGLDSYGSYGYQPRPATPARHTQYYGPTNYASKKPRNHYAGYH